MSKVDWVVPLADLDYGEEEETAVQDVLRSRWLTMGEITREFEREFAEFIGVKHAVAVSNGTVALHLACLALGIVAGNEIILPSLTFVATANAVSYSGARLRFADILGVNELTISPQDIERQITSKTKAIIVVHFGGFPCHMGAIREVANCHQLAVIEDAAHAPGASLNGISLGAWGDVGCFSFFSNKNIATGEGGMLVTNNDNIAEKVRILRSHGMTTLTWDRHRGHAYTYDVVDLGYNYRIDEIHSALGRVQLKKIFANNNSRRKITERYWQALGDTGVELPFRDCKGIPAYHIFPLILPQTVDRKRFMDYLRSAGIQTSIHYPPVHEFTFYRQQYPTTSLPITEDIGQREVTLPLYPTMSETAVDYVISTAREALGGE